MGISCGGYGSAVVTLVLRSVPVPNVTHCGNGGAGSRCVEFLDVTAHFFRESLEILFLSSKGTVENKFGVYGEHSTGSGANCVYVYSVEIIVGDKTTRVSSKPL